MKKALFFFFAVFLGGGDPFTVCTEWETDVYVVPTDDGMDVREVTVCTRARWLDQYLPWPPEIPIE